MPTDVFISYTRATAQTASRQLRDQLSQRGFKVFLDEREIPYGNPFPRELADGLLDSRLAIVFADEAYFRRPWCVYEFQVITAPYRAASDVKDEQLEHVVVALPDAGDITGVLSHLPPPLAHISWPTVSRTREIVQMIDDRLQGLTTTLAARLTGVNDDAVNRLRAGGDIPWAWGRAAVAQPDQPATVRALRPRCIELAPETRGEAFIGRSAEVWRVFHHLVTSRAFSIPRACAVQGLGGSGKSQLAAEFIARYGDRFFPAGVVWISADVDTPTLNSQFENVLRALSPVTADPAADESDPERRRDKLAAALATCFASDNSGTEFLWVVDGFPEPTGDKPRKLSYWCPTLGFVNVLVTSRRTRLEHMDAYVELGGLPASAAVELLTRPDVDRRWLNEDEWKDLADWVGGLPLAISILRAGLSDGFTTAEALKLARRKEPSPLLDREMDALRGQIEDERLRGITDAFDFSYRALERNPELRGAAHLFARLAPYPITENVLTDLVPSRLVGQLATRSWIQAGSAASDGHVVRRWIMHRIPASFLRARSAAPAEEYRRLFNWLTRVAAADVSEDDIRALEYHLMVIRHGLMAHLHELGNGGLPALQAAREFATTTVARSLAGTKPTRATAGFRFLAAGLANQLGAGEAVTASLEQAYATGNLDVVTAIPHTLQALAGSAQAAELMGRLLQDPRDEVRYQAILHASSLRAVELAGPLLRALLNEPTGNLAPGFDVYLDNRSPAVGDLLKELMSRLDKGTPRERERAAQLLGRALIVNGKNLAAGQFMSHDVVTALLRFALNEDSATIAAVAVASAAHYFDGEAYQMLVNALAQAQDRQHRARLLTVLGRYLAETRRPPPPKVLDIEWLDSGGLRISGQVGQAEPLPAGVYDPLIKAAGQDDPLCAAVAARAILETDEGKIAASEAAHRLLDGKAYAELAALAGALADAGPEFTNAYWWRGQAREELANAGGALDDYSTVVQQAPNFADAYLHRGRLLLQSKQFAEALPDLSRAGELNPELFVAHHLASLCLYNLERYTEAEAAADRAIALAPHVGEPWFFRGIARYGAGRAAEALQDIRRAVELDPSDQRAVQFKAQLEAYVGAAG